MQNFDILTLVFLGLAIFVIMKLREVLGQRTGFEKPPNDLSDRRGSGADAGRAGGESPMESNVVPMPGMRRADMSSVQPEPETRLAKLLPKNAPAFKGLIEIMEADSSFDPKEFIDGARAAYEMIVLAFAGGDRATLKDLLAKDVYDGFESAISEREARQEKVEMQFVSIDKADFYDALLRGKNAQVTVRFLTKLITVTRDAAGIVVDGSAEKTIDVNDIWTFARDVSSRDPNWRLIATESAQ